MMYIYSSLVSTVLILALQSIKDTYDVVVRPVFAQLIFGPQVSYPPNDVDRPIISMVGRIMSAKLSSAILRFGLI